MLCTHWQDGWGKCDAPAVARYLTGPRCAAHTPAAVAGHPETVPDPARTLAGLRSADTGETRRHPDVDAVACVLCGGPAAPVSVELWGQPEHVACHRPPARRPASTRAAA